MTKKIIGTGILFQNTAKSVFVRITGQRYDNMLARVEKKGFYGLPFTKDQFRERVLAALGGQYDGFLRCIYCNGYFTIEQIGIDHAIPLGRGGGVELDNLEFPCAPDNNRKGQMTPTEYFKLLEFLDDRIPLAKTDVLHRLEISVQLAAGWRQAKAKRDRESGLEEF